MRNSSIIAAGLVMALSAVSAAAFAHGAEKHKTAPANAQMQRLHDMMPIYSSALANLEQAVEKRDVAAVEAETGRMLATIPDLKKSRPHKNLKKLKTFREIAAGLERDLKEVEQFAGISDYDKAKTALNKVEVRCGECHVKFR